MLPGMGLFTGVSPAPTETGAAAGAGAGSAAGAGAGAGAAAGAGAGAGAAGAAATGAAAGAALTLVMRKELGDIPDSSAMAAIITATSSPSSTAGAAGAGAAAGAAGFATGAGAAVSFLPSSRLTSLELIRMTRARMASIRKTTTRPHTATMMASVGAMALKGSKIAFSAFGMDHVPP